jgi:hypothetical protein
MNEDGTAIVDQENVSEPLTENISAADGGETTTEDEVAKLLHLPSLNGIVEDNEDDEDEATKLAEEEAETRRLADEAAEKQKNDEASAEQAKVEEKNKNKSDVEEPKTFTMEVEDANGQKITLSPDDDIEEMFKDFEPKNNGQIFKILDDLHQLRAEKSAYDTDQSVKSEEAERTAKINEIQEGWDSEIKSLQGEKRIPISTDGKEEPRIAEVFKFMGEENEKRVASNRPTINSFEDALDKLELRETKEEAAKKAKDAKELARTRGGMVGGSSAPSRTASQALKQMKVL